MTHSGLLSHSSPEQWRGELELNLKIELLGGPLISKKTAKLALKLALRSYVGNFLRQQDTANQRNCLVITRVVIYGRLLVLIPVITSQRSCIPSNRSTIHNARRGSAATRASNISASPRFSGLSYLCWSGIGSLHSRSFSGQSWFGIGCLRNGPLPEIGSPWFSSAQHSRCCLA